MQLHNDPEATTSQEYTERIGYRGFSQYSEPSFNQEYQQQAYYPPISDYDRTFYGQKTPPLSDSRFAAILSYSCGWLTGLPFLLFGGRDRFIRFHALQSLVFFGTITLIDFGLFIMMINARHHSYILIFIYTLFFLLLNFIAFVSWIVAMVQTARGEYFKLPFVGEWIAQHFNLPATPLW